MIVTIWCWQLEGATAAHDVLRERVKELENENENLESKNDEYSSIVKEMEGEIDSMREDQQSSAVTSALSPQTAVLIACCSGRRIRCSEEGKGRTRDSVPGLARTGS